LKGTVTAKAGVSKTAQLHPRLQASDNSRSRSWQVQAQAAREYQITENTISKWRKQHHRYNDRAFRRPPVMLTQMKHAWLNLSEWLAV